MWPQAEFPLIPVGRFVLDRNPKDYFAEIEQIAFSPSHMVPGVEPSPDKMLQVRKAGRKNLETSLTKDKSLLGSTFLISGHSEASSGTEFYANSGQLSVQSPDVELSTRRSDDR